MDCRIDIWDRSSFFFSSAWLWRPSVVRKLRFLSNHCIGSRPQVVGRYRYIFTMHVSPDHFFPKKFDFHFFIHFFWRFFSLDHGRQTFKTLILPQFSSTVAELGHPTFFSKFLSQDLEILSQNLQILSQNLEILSQDLEIGCQDLKIIISWSRDRKSGSRDNYLRISR